MSSQALLEPVSISEGFRLSPQQRRLWPELRGNSEAFSVHYAVRLEGPLDRERWRAAVDRAAGRHEILATTFRSLPGMDVPLQVIAESKPEWSSSEDLGMLAPEAQQSRWREWLDQARRTPFDLENGPLLRLRMITLAPLRHVMLVSLPSLNADTETVRNLVRETGALYGSGGTAAEEPVQYADLAEWQNELLESPEMAAGREYWRQQSLSSGAGLRLPFDRPPTLDPRFAPDRLGITLAPVLSDRLLRLGRRLETPPEILLEAGWMVLLGRLGGHDEVTVETAFSGRKYEELTGALGLFVRYLPIVCPLRPGQRFVDVIAALGEAWAYATKWQELFDWRELSGEASTGAIPSSPFGFRFEDHLAESCGEGLVFTLAEGSARHQRFSIELVCELHGGVVRAEFDYDTELYPSAEIERLASRFHKLLSSALDHPETPVGKLPWLVEVERQQLLVELNQTAEVHPEGRTVHEIIALAAARAPDRVAAVFEEDALSYGGLDRLAGRLAHELRSRGVRAGSLVPICLERSLDFLVAMLGVLKAGGAYVPLDPLLLEARMQAMLDDLREPIGITEETLLPRLPVNRTGWLCMDADRGILETLRGEGLEDTARLEDPAYVIFTSGSTGRPKGVIVEHRQLVNYLHSIRRRLGLEEGMGFALVSTFAADLGHTAIYPTLCGGGCLHVIAPQRCADPERLTKYLRRRPVDGLKIVPSHLEALLSGTAAAGLLPRERLVLGGEALSRGLVERIETLGGSCAIFNHYGPTEATVGVTAGRVAEDDLHTASTSIPLGRPIGNVRIYLLDPYGEPVPRGVAGELYIGGAAVARGYLRRPAQTAERFVPDPFGTARGGRLYRSGDLARYLEDGSLECLGRVDHQVKIRGFRVELGEIEIVLESHPGVGRAAVSYHQDAPEARRLAAYLVPDRQRAFGVWQHLRLEREGLLQDRSLMELANGTMVLQINERETRYLYREIFEERAYLRHGIALPPRACVFDVGAHVGLFSLFVQQHCEAPRIYAFEPVAPMFELLRLNRRLHGLDVELFPCGLAEKEAHVEFTHYPQLTLMSGRYAVEERSVAESFLLSEPIGDSTGDALLDELVENRLAQESYTCPLKTLSQVLREEGVGRIDLLKIHVPQSELDVLAGIATADWDKIQQVVVEVLDIDGRVEAVKRLLEGHGYRVAMERKSALQGSQLFDVYAVRTAAVGSDTSSVPRGSATVWKSRDALRDDVRAFLSHRLPDFMVPPALVLLDALPLTANGKVDRQALPRPAEYDPAAEVDFVAPRTSVEELLADLWAELLGGQRVGVHHDFFDLGGHSLLATRLTSRIREVFGVEILLRHVFDTPTIADLARRIEAALKTAHRSEEPPIEAVPRDQPMPLSFAQQRLWFLHRMEPDVPAYNVPFALTLSGRLDRRALQASVDRIRERHEILRTTFQEIDGQPVQIIAPPSALRMPLIDLSGLPEALGKRWARRHAEAEARRTFDLRQGPLLRIALVRLSKHEHVALCTLHHIVTDGWSKSVLVREICEFYVAALEGREAMLPELQVQYADFAHWQRRWLQGEVLGQEIDYWKQQLGGELPPLGLPTDRPRPRVKSWRGANVPLELSDPLSEALRELSRQQGVTLFMALLAALKTLLYRYTGQPDIIVGSGVAHRTRAEIEGLIGFFLNTLALRTDVSGNPTFRELLMRVRQVALGAFAHQDVPFERIIEELKLERRPDQAPLCNVMFGLQNAPEEHLELPELTLVPFESRSGTSKSDLILTLSETDTNLIGSLEYDVDLFDEATMVTMLEHFREVLEAVTENPECRLLDIPMSHGPEGRAEERASDAELLDSFQSLDFNF